MNKTLPETIVIGHRNPDADSIAAAHALAELKRLKGEENVVPACAGLPGERTEYLFKRFNVPMPKLRRDVYPRVRDIMTRSPLAITRGSSLIDAISLLEKHRVQRIPVIDENRKYHGILSLFMLLDGLLQTAGMTAGSGLTGRRVRSSVALINEVLNGKMLSADNELKTQDFEVYVAAMNIESFKEHIPRDNPDTLAIVVGDRVDIHLMSINIGARVMIVTGSRRVDNVVIKAAIERGVSIIKTPFDSATVIRRLKLSSPVELLSQPEMDTFRADDRICDIRRRLFSGHDDIFPVVDENGILLGSFGKSDIERIIPFQVIMVDHNEFDQGVEGIEEVPVIEVVDHHRFGMPPTAAPIRITCDSVGSTCTLVTEMFFSENAELSAATAGILLGGIITDTLMLRSPTTTSRDKAAMARLQEIAGVNAEQLTGEIFRIGSLIARVSPREVLLADRKNFTSGNIRFAVAQVEEVSFDQFMEQLQLLREDAAKLQEEEKLDFFCLLVTNVVREDSLLMAVGRREILEMFPYRRIQENLYDLPDILSRKKQLLPQLLKITAAL